MEIFWDLTFLGARDSCEYFFLFSFGAGDEAESRFLFKSKIGTPQAVERNHKQINTYFNPRPP